MGEAEYEFYLHTEKKRYKLKPDIADYFPGQHDIFMIKGLGIFKTFGNLFLPHPSDIPGEPKKAIIRTKKLMPYNKYPKGKGGYYGTRKKSRSSRNR
ncbi:hypothetical protein D3C72_1148900 [compost metagenome]